MSAKELLQKVLQKGFTTCSRTPICRTALTSCFWINYLCTIHSRPTMALQCVIHCQHLKTTSKIIPLNQRKFQNLNRNREARHKLGGENTHEQQSKSIPSSFDPSKHGAHTECHKNLQWV